MLKLKGASRNSIMSWNSEIPQTKILEILDPKQVPNTVSLSRSEPHNWIIGYRFASLDLVPVDVKTMN